MGYTCVDMCHYNPGSFPMQDTTKCALLAKTCMIAPIIISELTDKGCSHTSQYFALAAYTHQPLTARHNHIQTMLYGLYTTAA